MAVPSSITDLSTTASSNSPSGSENPKEGDNHLRAAYSFIRTLYNWLTDGLSAITCAALTAKGNVVLGDAAGDTLNVASGAIAVDASGDVSMSGDLAVTGTASAGGIELGYRGLPKQSGGYVAGVNGKMAAITAGVTITTGDLPEDSIVSFYNNSASAITITQGASTTLRLAGTTATGNRTLAPRGMATAWYFATGEIIISGAGVS